MSASDVAAVTLAAVAVLGIIVAITRWFFTRGAEERELALAVRDNTEATRDLSGDFRSFRDSVAGELRSLDVRVTRIEASRNGGATASHDTRPPGGR